MNKNKLSQEPNIKNRKQNRKQNINNIYYWFILKSQRTLKFD
jgi:hypothetical protein